MPPWLLLVIYTLATLRLTGLATADVITAGLRDRVRAWFIGRRGHRHVAYLIGDGETDGCPWCAGWWISLTVAPAAWFLGDHPALLVPALVLAFSQCVGMLGRVGR